MPSEAQEADGVVDEAYEETAEAVAEEEAVNRTSSSRVQAPLHPPPPATKVPNTQIFRQGSGKDAPCISNSGGGHTFVLSLHPAPGRMFSLSDLLNETGTNSAFKLIPLTKN